jgi:hypothetical protein
MSGIFDAGGIYLGGNSKMNTWKIFFWSAIGILLTWASLFLSAPPPVPKFDIEYSAEVVTPHIDWAGKLPGGPIKGFFIPSVTEGRDMVELMQRLTLDPVTVTIDRNWDFNCWGIGDYYGHEFRGDINDFQTVYGYVEKELTSSKPFEVMLIPGLNGWSRMTKPARDAILRRVEEGAGLVLLHPFVGDVKAHPFKGDEKEGDARIWELSALKNCPDDFISDGAPELNNEAILKGKWEMTAPHFITRGVPLELLPAGTMGSRFYKYQPNGQVLIQSAGYPILAVKNYGKGRVASLAYVEQGFIPEVIDPVESKIYWNYWEYEYALLARCLVWAAGREGGVALQSVAANPANPDLLTLQISSNSARELEILVTACSEYGFPLASASARQSLQPGINNLRIPASKLLPVDGWPGGKVICDVILKDLSGGTTLDWGTTTFTAAKQATVTTVRTNGQVYQEGDTLSIVTNVAGNLTGLKVRVKVEDDLERVIYQEEKNTEGEKYFFCPLRNFLGKWAQIKAELVDARGTVVDQLRAKPVMVVQKERRQKEYTAQLSFETPRHFWKTPRLHTMHELGIDSGFTWGGSVNNSLDIPRGYFGVYWYDRGPTTPEGVNQAIAQYEKTGDFNSLQYLTKKELYKRTGDKKFLARTPCLDDPAVLDLLASVSRTAARNKAPYQMDYYFVGDEGSLASYTDPVDFCWSPHTLRKFRLWLREQYGSLEALNRVWKSSFNSWDAVIPLTTEEARQQGNYPPWADHRTYMEVSFANAYKTVRQAVTQGDPQGHIALSGTQVTTPYDGCDWYRLDQIIDDFLSYSGGNQWDLHRSFAKPGSRIGFWTGYGRSGAAVQNEIWTAALNNVLHPNLFWSPSVINPDFTWSRSGRDMGETFRSLKYEGVGKLLMEAERINDGVAIHYSMSSVHAAGILGMHPRRNDDDEGSIGFPANRGGWSNCLGDLGLGFEFISYAQVEKGALNFPRQKVLILPLSMALSSQEVQNIRRFAEQGGTVIADAGAGLMDEHCAWKEEGSLNTLFGISTPPSSQRELIGSRETGPLEVTSDGKAWSLVNDQWSGLELLEPSLKSQGARPLLTIAGKPALLAQRVGKGWTLYLNLLLDHYTDLRDKNYGGGSYRSLISQLLRHVGIHPAFNVLTPEGSPFGQASIAHYRLGENEILAVLNNSLPVQTHFGVDGVQSYTPSDKAPISQREVVVRLPGIREVTDVRAGSPLGPRDVVKTSIRAGDALILALNPSRSTIQLKGPRDLLRGEQAEFVLKISGPGKHLVRCHFFDPQGRFLPDYARNLMIDGTEGTVPFPSAFNDPPGEYKLKATELLSGATAEATMVLK